MAGKSASHSEWKTQARVEFPKRHIFALYLALDARLVKSHITTSYSAENYTYQSYIPQRIQDSKSYQDVQNFKSKFIGTRPGSRGL